MAEIEKGISILSGNISTCLGNLDATWAGLLEGKSGLVKKKIPSCATEYPLGIVPCGEGALGANLRFKAFIEELLDGMPVIPESTQLFVATTKGAVDDISKIESGLPFTEGMPWTVADTIKARLQLKAEPVTVSAACASGSLAAIQAAMALDSGGCQHALVVAVDIVSEFVLRGFDCLKALSPTTVKPFDQNRDGLALGDGGAWVFMSSDEKLCSRHGRLGLLKRWGIGCDATHITAPCRKGSGLGRVFDQIQKTGSDSTCTIGAISGHGTGTGYNDAMEMLIFDQKCGSSVPFGSVKGALGHSLGAAGLIEVVLSLKSLQEMKLPPTVGLVKPDADRRNVSGTESLELTHPSILSCNSGFGGINAGVYLVKGE